MIKFRLTLIFAFVGCTLAQDNQQEQPTFSDFRISSERYLTDGKGNILMYINIWGEVNNPGRHLVYDGIDMATLLSIVGGPSQGANMKKVRLYREIPDEDNILTYNLNLSDFISKGDRSGFIKIKPNDTILIPPTLSNTLLNQIGTLNTLFSLLNLYFVLESKFTSE